MIKEIDIVSAGAGSGKTYEITEKLGNWIADGKVRPDRVVAVTFTEAAASELRDRIINKLLESGHIYHANKLTQAYITTIHGFGRRILTEFVFDAGLRTPNPELIEEDEQDALIRRAISHASELGPIIGKLRGYGYTWSYSTKKSAEDQLRDHVHEVINMLRFIDATTNTERLETIIKKACAALRDNYGKVISDGTALEDRLRRRIQDLLRVYPASRVGVYDPSKLSNAAKKEFNRDYTNLSKARNAGELHRDWPLWESLRKLRVKNTRKICPFEEGYREMAESVQEAANGLLSHPGPLEMAETQIRALLQAAFRAGRLYESLKVEAECLDYTDMLATVDSLLRNNQDVLNLLAQRIDVLVVDELQDTNPLMFSILWQIHLAGVPILAVGDLKQAIMGFQGADPQLFEALSKKYSRETRELESNWRSQPALLDFLNKIGTELFGSGYKLLSPGKYSTGEVAATDGPLEFLRFSKSCKHKERAYSVANRLRELLRSGFQIPDSYTGNMRSIRGSDIAVLCPTNLMLKEYASVLRADFGLRVNLRESGWYESRAVEVVCHALQFVHDVQDIHAALYLVTTEFGALKLEDALDAIVQNHASPASAVEELCKRAHRRIAPNECVLCKLRAVIKAGDAAQTTHAFVMSVIEELNVFERIASWADGMQQRANLVRLLNLSEKFSQTNVIGLARTGYFGGGIPTFLSWLNSKKHQDNGQPENSVVEEDAIVLSTWHKSKGLEWPIVVVSGLQRNFRAELPDLAVNYRSFDNLSNLLHEATIRYLPKYDAPEKNGPSKQILLNEEIKTAKRLLYVVMTRPCNKLIMEWPSYSRAKNAYYSLLKNGVCKNSVAAGRFEGSSHKYECLVRDGQTKSIDVTDSQGYAGLREEMLPDTGHRALQRWVAIEETSETVQPSDIELDSNNRVQGTSDYGEGLLIEVSADGLQYGFDDGSELGLFLHRCYTILAMRPDLKHDLNRLTNSKVMEADIEPIRNAVARFETWLTAGFQPLAIKREWPLLGKDDQGRVISGVADVIVEVADGVWLIDHKSDVINTRNAETKLKEHSGQIQAYVDLLYQNNRRVLGAGIHWIRRGEISWTHLAPGQVIPRSMSGAPR